VQISTAVYSYIVNSARDTCGSRAGISQTAVKMVFAALGKWCT